MSEMDVKAIIAKLQPPAVPYARWEAMLMRLCFAVLVWFIIRCVKGFQAVDKGEPISNVESWII